MSGCEADFPYRHSQRKRTSIKCPLNIVEEFTTQKVIRKRLVYETHEEKEHRITLISLQDRKTFSFDYANGREDQADQPDNDRSKQSRQYQKCFFQDIGS